MGKEAKQLKKEIERRYNEMLNYDSIKEGLQNKPIINIYLCSNGHQTVTKDVDAGTTPFMHLCATKGCMEFGRSKMYQVDQTLEPVEEWFRPTLKQTLKMDSGMQEHILPGGLEVRKINNK